MVIEEQERIELPIRIENLSFSSSAVLPQWQEIPGEDFASEIETGPSFELAPESFAERHPRLMYLAVAATILLAAVAAEVECLQAAGYSWR